MRKIIDGKSIELTPEELALMEAERRKADLMERTRPLTVEEVTSMLLTQQVNSLTVDDNTALRMREFYPAWAEGVSYPISHKVRYDDKLYKVLQAHTSQIGWEPSNTPSLWAEICERHDGTQDDPILYSGNMVLTNGLYYTQDYEVYKCTRDTGNPVYHALRELVGLYVELV